MTKTANQTGGSYAKRHSPSVRTAPWTEWWQDDRPCLYSREQAKGNALLLAELLGHSWLEEGQSGNRNSHPILTQWAKSDVGSFLSLNCLAEDLRRVLETPGFYSVVHDLKQQETYQSTMLLIHSAATFVRGGARLVKFFEPSNDSIPDYLLEHGGVQIPVEVKQLTQSNQSRKFYQYSSELQNRISSEIFSLEQEYPSIYIVIKDADNLPDMDELIRGLSICVADFKDCHVESRNQRFNIFLNSPPNELKNYKFSYVLCKRSKKEAPRLIRHVEKANKQLDSYSKRILPGILILGITEHQDENQVKNLINMKFRGSQYRSISSVMLWHTGTYLEREYSIADMWGIIHHPNAHVTLPELQLRWEGWAGDFFDQPPANDVSAYRDAFVQAQFDGMGDQMIGLPDIRRLTPDLLT